MTKIKKPDQVFDLKTLFINKESKSSEMDIDFEKALSKGLLYALEKFNKSSHITKRESRDMAVLMSTNETQREMCSRIISHRRDYKRKSRVEWISIIKHITSSIKRDNENSSAFSFLKRER